MKKFRTPLLAAILAICLSLKAYPQYHDASRVDNLIKMNPFSLVVGTFSFSYEHKVGDAETLQLGINFTPEPVKFFGIPFSCFGITPEYRIYLSHRFINVPGGGYIAPFTRWRCLTMAVPEQFARFWKSDIRDDQFACGIVLGYQYITPGTISFDFFAGPFYNSNNFNCPIKIPVNNQLAFLGNDGPGLLVGGSIGFGF